MFLMTSDTRKENWDVRLCYLKYSEWSRLKRKLLVSRASPIVINNQFVVRVLQHLPLSSQLLTPLNMLRTYSNRLVHIHVFIIVAILYNFFSLFPPWAWERVGRVWQLWRHKLSDKSLLEQTKTPGKKKQTQKTNAPFENEHTCKTFYMQM